LKARIQAQNTELIDASLNGQIARVDRFGRIQIPGFLKKKIRLEGEIVIEEREDHLELMPMRMQF